MSDALPQLVALLDAAPIVPLVQSDDPDGAVALMQALRRGGLSVVEVVLRTERAYEVVEALCDKADDEIVGAGTILSAQNARDAVAAGARFLVSPGLDDGVVEVARELNVPVLPGVATATEAQRAWNMGLRQVKVFPASQSGGTGKIRALASVFQGMRFMPTGGIGAANLAEYLACPEVLACGGSWLTPKAAVASGDFDTVERLCREALAIAADVRG
ncbi:MAG: bifunctional 4-hydroxy-2-oxoglutarate aldolase/2-dehydro-3-deoxy-phosphogluconate aldolase [Gammaproteobacteria bacterium]